MMESSVQADLSVYREMTKKIPTPTIEDYLGIIYTLERDGDEVIGVRLAELLEVSPPTVTITLRRMARDGWINISANKQVHLTKTGKEAAKAVIRRHMLTEWMLAKILNLPWSKIHEEADKIEHSISNQVEVSLIDTLDDPDQCPHGNPMPGMETLTKQWVPLSSIGIGEQVIIRRVHEFLEDDPVLMKFLESGQVIPGNQAYVLDIPKSKNMIRLKINTKQVDLELNTAKSIFVERF